MLKIETKLTMKEWVAVNKMLAHYQVTVSCMDATAQEVEKLLLPEMYHIEDDIEDEEYTQEDAEYDRASSNAGELI